jgi:hypothetical protein
VADLTEPVEAAAEVAQRKVGPLPLYAWLGIAVALVAGVAWYRRRQGRGPADAPTEPEGDPVATAPANPVLTTGGFTVGAAAGSTSSAPPSSPNWSAPVARTNYDWRQAAESYAIAANFSPTLAATAINKYLSGQGLTVQERAVVDNVLRNVGPTPEPVPPPFNEPTPDPGNSGAPPSEVGDSAPSAPATWRQVPWGVMGNLSELLDNVRSVVPELNGKTDAQVIAWLESNGYYAWQRSTGGPIQIGPRPA